MGRLVVWRGKQVSSAPSEARMAIDPRKLFVPIGPPVVSDREEIDAVATGRKPMALVTVPLSDALEGDPEYVALLERALENRLLVVHQCDRLRVGNRVGDIRL